MPDQRTTQVFDQLLEEALDNAEIQEGAKQASLQKDVLKSQLTERASRVWGAAASEIETFNRLENSRNEIERKLAGLRYDLRPTSRFTRRGSNVKVLVGVGGIVAALTGVIALLPTFNVTNGLTAQSTVIGAILGIVGALFGAFLTGRFSEWRGTEEYPSNLELRRELAKHEAEYERVQARLQAAELALRRAVVEKGMLPELRSIINVRLEPRYETSLTVPFPPGLAEVFNPEYEISTEPKERLYRRLSNMPGGSIGVAGPRGAGKTTLLRAFCSKESINELKNRPVLSVMVSAPVEYDARDFILHIFSSICQRVFELKSTALPSPWEDVQDSRIPPSTFFGNVMGWRDALALAGVGFILVVINMIIDTKSFEVSEAFLSSIGIFLVTLGILGLLVHILHASRQQQRDASRSSKPGSDDLLLAKAGDHLREIRFQQSYSSGWSGSLQIPMGQITAEVGADAAVSLARHQLSLPEIMDMYRGFIEEAREQYEIIIGIDELDKIGSDEKAQQFLNEIKALFGLESCFYLVSISESALSSFERRGLPIRDVFDSSFDEVVYVDYLDLSRGQQLLRRRAIGVPIPFLDFCYCMTGGLPRDLIRAFRNLFEERGQPYEGRDELETLCGSLIKSELTSKSRATLIEARRRMAEPKAEQLIRMIREVESWLESPDQMLLRHEDLLDYYQGFLDIGNSPDLAAQSNSADAAEEHESVSSLATNLAVYMYYCATLAEFFGRQREPAKELKEAESSGFLDRLSRAHQSFAISPRISEATIKSFRQSYKLSVP